MSYQALRSRSPRALAATLAAATVAAAVIVALLSPFAPMLWAPLALILPFVSMTALEALLDCQNSSTAIDPVRPVRRGVSGRARPLSRSGLALRGGAASSAGSAAASLSASS